MQVQAWIVVTQAGVRHVFETIAKGHLGAWFVIKTHVRRKLQGNREVSVAILGLLEIGGTETGRKRKREALF